MAVEERIFLLPEKGELRSRGGRVFLSGEKTASNASTTRSSFFSLSLSLSPCLFSLSSALSMPMLNRREITLLQAQGFCTRGLEREKERGAIERQIARDDNDETGDTCETRVVARLLSRFPPHSPKRGAPFLSCSGSHLNAFLSAGAGLERKRLGEGCEFEASLFFLTSWKSRARIERRRKKK